MRQPNSKWRLKKTLGRNVSFRPIEAEDMRFIWAAYRAGALASMGENLANGHMEPEEFKDEFEAEILENYHGAWTLFAETPKGFKPAGLALGFYSHHDPSKAPFMILGDLIWFPWTSPRNKVEAAVNFFNTIRNEIPMVEYADFQAKPFFEMIAKHGVMRRVGTSHNVYPGEPTAIFETRRP